MKVFIATKETQGFRKNDFSHATDGELVKFAFECDGETVDGSCGCRRSMAGVESHKATTTVKVAEMDISAEEYAQRIIDSDIEAGWGTGTKEEIADFCADIKRSAMDLLRAAADFPAGVVVEKRGNLFRERPSETEIARARIAKKLPAGVQVLVHGGSGSTYQGRLMAKPRSSVNAVVMVFSKNGRPLPEAKYYKVRWEQIESIAG